MGVSSLRRFQGEDNEAKLRAKKQAEQQRDWIQQQQREKQEKQRREKEIDRYDESSILLLLR